MKRLLAVLLVMSATCAHAQTFTDASNIARADLRVKKAELMTQAMRLEEAKSELFWPIYREYEREIDGVLERRLDLIRLYAGNYEIMDDAKAKTLAIEAFKLAKDRLSIEEKYYKEMEKAIGAVSAVRFAQVDSRINTMLDMEIERTIPLIATRDELGLPPREEKK